MDNARMNESETPGLPRHLSASDSVAWRIESNPLLRSTITLVFLLDRAPNHHALRSTIEAASVGFPRLRQRVVDVPLRASTPVWAVDPNLDMDYHVRTIRAGDDRSHRGVLRLAASMAMEAFDRARPLWQWTTVDDLEDGRSAVILKVHHSVTDGVGGVQLMSQLFDLERDDAAIRRVRSDDQPTGEATDARQLLIEGLRHEADLGIGQVRMAAVAAATAVMRPRSAALATVQGLASTARLVAPASGPLSPLMTGRSSRLHFESFEVPLGSLKAAARRTEGKLNDAFMTAVMIGLRRYHEINGMPVDALRVNMPINLRTAASTAGGNHWAPARFVVPLGGDDVDEHMREVREIVLRQRAEPALRYAGAIAAALDKLPTMLLTSVMGGMLTCLDVAASNVPGAPAALYLAGARVDSMETFAPPSGAAVNVALLSYQQSASIGLNIDPAAVADPETLRDCICWGFDAVIDPSTVGARVARGGRRRAPSRSRRSPSPG